MAGTVKAFGLPVEYVLHELSYVNLVLLGATLPTYSGGGRKGWGDAIDAGDSRNNAAVAAAFRE